MKKNLVMVLVIVLIFGVIGCSTDEDLVLQDIEAIDSETIEATFVDGIEVQITDFTPTPLQTGINEIKFEYEGISYEGIVNYETNNDEDIIDTTDPKFFEFDSATGTITDYDEKGGSDVVIPNKIDGVQVKKIQGGNWDDWGWEQKPAFYNKGLTSVVIPESIIKISAFAFEGYNNSNNLTEVKIPDGITEIRDFAFNDNDLTEVEIPNSVTKIGSFVFEDNDLTEIVMPSNVDLEVSIFGDDLMGEGTKFKDYYNTLNKQAGTYIRENINSDWKIKK